MNNGLYSLPLFLQAGGYLEKEGVDVFNVVVPWVHPRDGYFKINCDGASNEHHFAGIGGVIRGDNGVFQACYVKHIYRNNSNVAEIWAIRNGLLLAKELGIQKI